MKAFGALAKRRIGTALEALGIWDQPGQAGSRRLALKIIARSDSWALAAMLDRLSPRPPSDDEALRWGRVEGLRDAIQRAGAQDALSTLGLLGDAIARSTRPASLSLAFELSRLIAIEPPTPRGADTLRMLPALAQRWAELSSALPFAMAAHGTAEAAMLARRWVQKPWLDLSTGARFETWEAALGRAVSLIC